MEIPVGSSFSGMTLAAVHVFHVQVEDPTGKVVPQYSGNLLAPERRAEKLLPLAVNDSAGTWKIRVKDVLSGQSEVASVEVH
jgi:hypothetical protein